MIVIFIQNLNTVGFFFIICRFNVCLYYKLILNHQEPELVNVCRKRIGCTRFRVSSCKDTYGEKMIYEVKKNVNIL